MDDDPQIRERPENYLDENALRVSVVESGVHSRRSWRRKLDFVILDLRLASKDGMAILRVLRDTSAIPIVLLRRA